MRARGWTCRRLMLRLTQVKSIRAGGHACLHAMPRASPHPLFLARMINIVAVASEEDSSFTAYDMVVGRW